MRTTTEEYILQCNSGDGSWYDFRLKMSQAEAQHRIVELANERPTRTFRIVLRTTTEEVILNGH